MSTSVTVELPDFDHETTGARYFPAGQMVVRSFPAVSDRPITVSAETRSEGPLVSFDLQLSTEDATALALSLLAAVADAVARTPDPLESDRRLPVAGSPVA